MPIFRLKKEARKRFLVIDKSTTEDARLSWKARGILAYMLSKPDDFTFYLEKMAEDASDGIDSLRAGIKELQEFGYVKRYPIKAKGKIISWSLDVYEVPDGEFPLMEKPHVENPMLKNKELKENDLKEDINNTSISSKSTMLFLKECDLYLKDEIEDILIYFYETYKKRTGKDHPKLKQNQLERIYSFLAEMLPFYGYDESMIDEFFDEVKKTDYNVNHFATEGMYQILIRRVT